MEENRLKYKYILSECGFIFVLGCIHDYDELPGLAHFLEHMLFMGSKKYPQENHFDKYIRNHAGQNNGSTDEDRQDYTFDIAYDHLPEALDM